MLSLCALCLCAFDVQNWKNLRKEVSKPEFFWLLHYDPVYPCTLVSKNGAKTAI